MSNNSVLADWRRSVTTTTGTGTRTLAGAYTGFGSIESILGNGDTAYYSIFANDSNGNPSGDWEEGYGTYSTSGTTFARNIVEKSSNANALVNFSAGTKHVFLTPLSTSFPRPNVFNGCRLSLDSSLPVPTADKTAAATIYLLPYLHNSISLFNGYCWKVLNVGTGVNLAFTPQPMIALNGTVSTSVKTVTGLSSTTGLYPGMGVSAPNTPINTVIVSVDSSSQVTLSAVSTINGSETLQFLATGHDVFAYDSGGTVTLEVAGWTSSTARNTSIVLQDGVYVKSGDATRLYLGSFNLIANKCEDSKRNRLLWNNYNRVHRPIFGPEAANTATWNYTSGTWRQWNNSANNRITIFRGLDIDPADIRFSAGGQGSTGIATGISLDATTGLPNAGNFAAYSGGGIAATGFANYCDSPGLGYHFFQAMEFGATSGVFFGVNNSSFSFGFTGAVMG